MTVDGKEVTLQIVFINFAIAINVYLDSFNLLHIMRYTYQLSFFTIFVSPQTFHILVGYCWSRTLSNNFDSVLSRS